MVRALEAIVGPEHVQTDVRLTDASASRGIEGRAAAVVAPASAEGVAAVVAWCYEHGVAVVPRGGGTGFSGGAVPTAEDQVVIGLGPLAGVRSFTPELWQICVGAGAKTADVARRARESGLLYPP